MYVYVKLIHFAMQQKLTQHCKPTTLQQKLNKKKKKHLTGCYTKQRLRGPKGSGKIYSKS